MQNWFAKDVFFTPSICGRVHAYTSEGLHVTALAQQLHWSFEKGVDNIFLNQFCISGRPYTWIIVRWAVWSHLICFVFSKSPPTSVVSEFAAVLFCCEASDDETSPDFPSAWKWADHDCIQNFEWPVPLSIFSFYPSWLPVYNTDTPGEVHLTYPGPALSRFSSNTFTLLNEPFKSWIDGFRSFKIRSKHQNDVCPWLKSSEG